jgi:GNAT superfamily N-acetyltransferase
LKIKFYDGSRADLLPLFRLADESESQILSYYALGRVLAAYDGNSPIGIAQIYEEGRSLEIVSLAVSPERQGQGIGTRLIEEASSYCRHNRIARLIVCTGCWEADNIIFYLKRGFRIFDVKQDFFTQEKGYAASHRHQIRLEMRSEQLADSSLTDHKTC